MKKTEFIKNIESAVSEGLLAFEKVDPTKFNPPCSYRAEVYVDGKRYALNLHEAVLRIYDDIGLVIEITEGLAGAEALIKVEVAKRDPEIVFDKLAESWKKVKSF